MASRIGCELCLFAQDSPADHRTSGTMRRALPWPTRLMSTSLKLICRDGRQDEGRPGDDAEHRGHGGLG